MDNNAQIELLAGNKAIFSNLIFKVIIIGNSGVGKSSLTTKVVNDIFIKDHLTTVNFDFFSLNVKINDDIIKLQIWDTCGQEAYRSMIVNYFRNCSLAIIVYSIDDKESFDSIEGWINDLKIHSSPDVKLFLIGTKQDLENERKISTDQGLQYKMNYEIDLFMEVSAKTGFNAKEVFIEAAKMLYNEHMQYISKTANGRRASSLDSEAKNIFYKIHSNNNSTTVDKTNKCVC